MKRDVMETSMKNVYISNEGRFFNSFGAEIASPEGLDREEEFNRACSLSPDFCEIETGEAEYEGENVPYIACARFGMSGIEHYVLALIEGRMGTKEYMKTSEWIMPNFMEGYEPSDWDPWRDDN